MNNDVFAINEKKLDDLVLNIYNLSDQLAKIFEKMEENVFSTNNFYQSSDGDDYRKKFSQYITKFDTVVSNMRLYGDDLLRVKFQYKQNVVKNVDIFQIKKYNWIMIGGIYSGKFV